MIRFHDEELAKFSKFVVVNKHLLFWKLLYSSKVSISRSLQVLGPNRYSSFIFQQLQHTVLPIFQPCIYADLNLVYDLYSSIFHNWSTFELYIFFPITINEFSFFQETLSLLFYIENFTFQSLEFSLYLFIIMMYLIIW